MALTVDVASLPEELPTLQPRVIVELRQAAGDTWEPRPDLEPISASVHVASVGRSTGELRRNYGRLFEPGTPPVLADVGRDDLSGRWVQVVLLPAARAGDTPQPPEGEPDVAAHDDETERPRAILMRGRILAPNDAPDNAGAVTPRGRQVLPIEGPEDLLAGLELYTSRWYENGSVRELGWLPSFNALTSGGTVRGNRSAQRVGGCYHFGGDDLWTRLEMLEHVVAACVQTRDANGAATWPVWSLGGQTELLAGVTLPVPVTEHTETAGRLIAKIVDPAMGCDYYIVPTAEGFELRLYSLASQGVDVSGARLAPNPQRWQVLLDTAAHVTAQFEEDAGQRYDRVVIIGSRIVVCLSAHVDAGTGAAPLRLVPAWPAALAAAYQALTGCPDDPDRRRAVRDDERYRDVYTAYALELSGDWATGLYAPRVRLDGTIERTYVLPQSSVRHTLPWLPLREGYDYATDPPAWEGLAGVVPDYRPPLALIQVADVGFVPINKLGAYELPSCAISALGNNWGVRVQGDPNHALAKGHWAETAVDDGFDPPSQGINYDGLVATVALELDHRVLRGWELPRSRWRAGGRTKVLYEEAAELHLLAPNTVIGTNSDNTLRHSPATWMVLRDDRPYLAQVLAGAVARYIHARPRATLDYDALVPAASLGAVLETIGAGHSARQVNAPVTSVAWDFVGQRTHVGTGQAER
jgi:hypothetical protein